MISFTSKEHLISTPNLSVSRRSISTTDEALKEIAKKTVERKTGARGLRTVVEEVLSEVMFEAPADETITKVIVDAKCITDGEKPEIVRDEGKNKKKNG